MVINVENVLRLISPVLTGLGYGVWHLETHKNKSNNLLLRIYIDLLQSQDQQGISLEDCELVSRQVSALLEVEGVSDSYTLEVSSCGIERALYTLEHYRRYLNHKIHIALFRAHNGCKQLTGTLLEVADNTVTLLVAGDAIKFELSDICKARLISELNKGKAYE